MRRVLAGLGATAGLIALLAGAPWALSVWGRTGLLSSIDWRHVGGVPDDGRLMLGLLSVAGWAAWLVLAVSVVVELAESVDRLRAVRRRRPHRPLSLPGLDLPRLLVRGLVVTAVTAVVGIGSPRAATAVVVPAVASAPAYLAHTGVQDPSATVWAGYENVAAPLVGAETAPAAETRPLVELPAGAVGPQEGPEGLAARDDDVLLPRIAAVGPYRGSRGALEMGTRLVMPSSASADGTRVVVVAPGDALWRLAARYLGDGERWPEIFALNRDVITNPDLIYRGSRLRMPTSVPQAPGGAAAATEVAPLPVHAAAPQARPGEPAAVPGGVPGPAAAVPGRAPVPVDTAGPSGGAPSGGASPVSTVGPGTPTAQTQSVGGAATDQVDDARALSASQALALGVIGTVGAGFAAALVRTVRRRRDLQLALRAPGRRILFPSDSTRVVESALSLVGAPSLPDRLRMTLETQPESPGEPRAMGRDSSPASAAAMTVGRGSATVEGAPAPPGMGPEPATEESTPAGLLGGEREPALLVAVGTGPGDASHEPRHAIPNTAWATVTAGLTVGGPVDLDLESHGVVVVDLDDPQASWGTACAWALELACVPLDTGTLRHGAARIVAAGTIAQALVAADLESIVSVPTTETALDDLAATVSRQRQELEASGWSLQQARLDLDARDAWWPTVYLLDALDESSARRVDDMLRVEPRTAVSVIVVGGEPEGAVAPVLGARLSGSADRALLVPEGVRLRPVSLSALGAAGVVELLRTSGSDVTEPAPWYAHGATATGDGPAGSDDVPQVALAPTEDPPAVTEGPPVNVLQLLPRHAAVPMKEAVDVGDDSPGVTDFSHPTLMLLGPIALLGAAGPPPARAERSCIEYCAWMVEHPGATASHMAASLLVAEGTRRSNVSRLRGWLGVSEDGVPYLPEAYTGRLYLDPVVSSDWQRMQALVTPGINRVPVSTLVSALKLVRGAPLADAAPGQWHWAEELRTDMVSMIRDIGARVGDIALADGNLDLARWAASRALVASPGDEVLMRLRLRTEHRGGNRPEVERIVLHLTRHARVLGIDLDDETVEAIQEAIEGRPRARA